MFLKSFMEIIMGRQVKDNLVRYEQKFAIKDSFNASFIKNYIEFGDFGFKKAFENRQVNSIYYDYPNFDLLKQNIEGSSKRLKIRTRFYGKNNLFDKLFLEFKRKSGFSGWKNIFLLDGNSSEKYKFSDIYTLALNSNIPFEFVIPLIGLKPKILVSYKRMYYISFCKKYRITFDYDIEYKSLYGFEYISEIGETSMKSQRNIIKLKYNKLDHEDSFEIIKNIPLRVSKNSKYVEGLYLTGLITQY